MPKHRRPTHLARLATFASRSPLQVSLAAGVAGTLSLTGAVVAVAADAQPRPGDRPGARSPQARPVAFVRDAADIAATGSQQALHGAVEAARRERQAALAAAKARAERRRELARQRAADRRAERRAADARTASAATASRGTERMSASAANLLRAAAEVASGASYQYGAAGPTEFDCSGYTMTVFDRVGISLPRTSSAQRSVVQPVANPQPGDLVFVYEGPGGSISHVGIYGGGGYWWEAANEQLGVGKHRAWSSNISYGRVL